MNPRTRRIIQAVLYEVIAVVAVAPALALLFDEPVISTVGLTVLMSTVALVWNYTFNRWFERWEVRQQTKGRSFKRRVIHGLGFEGSLVVMLVPVMAYWLNISLLVAFVANLGVLAFFFVYVVGFTWAFDRIFGLPRSASERSEA